jgi:hypothetical protein
MVPSEVSAFSKGLRLDLGNATERRLLAATFIEPHNVNIPDSIDWKEKGAVRVTNSDIPNLIDETKELCFLLNFI